MPGLKKKILKQPKCKEPVYKQALVSHLHNLNINTSKSRGHVTVILFLYL